MNWTIALAPTYQTTEESGGRRFDGDPDALLRELLPQLRQSPPASIRCDGPTTLSVALSAAYAAGVALDAIQWRVAPAETGLKASGTFTTLRLDHAGLDAPRLGFVVPLGDGVEALTSRVGSSLGALTDAARDVLARLAGADDDATGTLVTDEGAQVDASRLVLATCLASPGWGIEVTPGEAGVAVITKHERAGLGLRARRHQQLDTVRARIPSGIPWTVDGWEAPPTPGRLTLRRGPAVTVDVRR